MENSRYINIRVVLDRLMNHPLFKDVTLDYVIDATVSFMRIVGVPSMFIEKTAELTVEAYKAELPLDFQEMIQVRSYEHRKVMYRYSDDSFHMSPNKEEWYDHTYKIQGGFIFTSTENTPIEISYRALNTDECGYILIPENSSFIRALELFIKKQWFTVLFDIGKLPQQVLFHTEQEYAWAVGDCATEFNRFTLDKAESFYNSWKTLVRREYQHNHGFRDNGRKEHINRH